MKELLNTFVHSTKERVRNPILSAFLLSFIVFNWKPIFIVLFASLTIQEKIETIEESYSTYFTNLWLPILFALFYVLALPYIMLVFDMLSKKAVEGRKRNILKQQLFDYESKKELAKKESELEDVKASYRDTAELNTKIDVLTNQIEERNKTISTLQNELNNTVTKNNEYKMTLNHEKSKSTFNNEESELIKEYELFKETDLFYYFEEIGSEISNRRSVPSKMNNMIIEKYIHSYIIKEIRDEEAQNTFYGFTEKGNFFWKTFVLNSNVSPVDDDDLPF